MPDTGAQSPSNEGDDYTGWTNPTNGYASDDSDTYPGGASAAHDWYDFGFSITAGSTIDGIEVAVEGAQSSSGGTSTSDVELSYDGGANYTSAGYSVSWVSTTDSIDTAGGAADTWGRSWSVSEFTNANFRVRLTNAGSKREDVDHITVTVYYTEPAAGGVPTQMIDHKRRRV